MHRLPFAEEIRHAAKIRRFERTALRLDEERLHDQIEDVRAMEVQEIENLRVLQALDLQLRVGLHIRRDKRRRRNAEHVEGEFLLLHQLGPGHSHELDADAHETDVVDVRRDVRTGPGKTHPGAESLRLRIDPVPEMLREIVVHDKFTADNAVGLRVPPRSMPPGFQSLRICFSKLAMIESRNASSSGSSFSSAIFKPSLGRFLLINRVSNRAIGSRRVASKRRAEEGIETAFQMEQRGRDVGSAS